EEKVMISMLYANYSKKNIMLNSNENTLRQKLFKAEGIKVLYTFFLISLFLISYIIVKSQYLFIENSQANSVLVICGFILPFVLWNFYFNQVRVDLINLSLIVLFLFSGSHSVLSLFGMESNAFFLNTTVREFDIFKASIIVILGVNFFVLGAMYSNSRRSLKQNKIIKSDLLSGFKTVNYVGIITLIIGAVSFLISFDSTILSSSYKNFGSETTLDLIWQTLLPVSGFVLMLSNDKLIRNLGISVCLFLSVYYLLLGNRGYSISL